MATPNSPRLFSEHVEEADNFILMYIFDLCAFLKTFSVLRDGLGFFIIVFIGGWG